MYLLDLLSTPLIGAIGALVGIGSLIIAVINRKRPKRLVYRVIDATSLVDINVRIRHKLRITFNNDEVQNLGRLRAELYNEGSEVIPKPKINIAFQQGTRILDVAAVSSMDDCEAVTSFAGDTTEVTFPFVNPYRDDRQTLLVSIIVDGNPEKSHGRGGGEGWFLKERRSPRPSLPLVILFCIFGFTLLTVTVTGTGWLPPFFKDEYGFGAAQLTDRVINAIPYAIMLLILSVIAFRVDRFFHARELFFLQADAPRTTRATLAKIRDA